MQERASKMPKENEAKTNYMARAFILGSCADAERLFSVMRNIMSQKRYQMSSPVFEAILFLIFNEHLRDCELVGKAMGRTLNE